MFEQNRQIIIIVWHLLSNIKLLPVNTWTKTYMLHSNNFNFMEIIYISTSGVRMNAFDDCKTLLFNAWGFSTFQCALYRQI